MFESFSSQQQGTFALKKFKYPPWLGSMSIDIAPELSEILAYIKEDVDNGSDTGSDMMMDRLEKVLTPVFEELSKTRQRNVELETELSSIDLVRIESVISRLFEVMSDIRCESFCDVDDFHDYVEELRRFTKPLGMKIYCYRNGESIPEEDLSIMGVRSECYIEMLKSTIG